jgi:peptidoglycan/LPS O-acetylase OafA/YrhL
MKQEMAFPGEQAGHVPWLDGLRGLAALWVLVSHAMILAGVPGIPLLSWGELAVDLFMLLSGFLMAHHYVLRREREPWTARSTFTAFWLRRFFRIAPLYYLVLTVAMLLGPWIGDWRDTIALTWPVTATSPARYDDQGWDNILMHVTFLFGALPHYAFRTPLPDWSIGLEMSFYLAFPFLMLLVMRFGALRAGLLAIGVSAALLLAMPGYFESFAMPSFLPMKLYLFFIGIWIAISRLEGDMRPALALSVLVLAGVVLVETHYLAMARIAMVVAMFYLMNNGTLPGTSALRNVTVQVRQLFSSRGGKFLGDTSYGVYLLHLLLLIPVAGMLTRFPHYLELSSLMRLALCLLLVAPPVYLLAWLLFRTVEMGGIQLGKAAARYFSERRATDCRPAET